METYPLGKLILIVEDDENTRDAMAALLGMAGYAVVQAENGEDALEKIRLGNVPCLILLDLTMPVMDGLEFRRRQLLEPTLAGIPVILCSAMPDIDRIATALRAVATLQKPKIEELLNVVAQHC